MARNDYWNHAAADLTLIAVDNAIASGDFRLLGWERSFGSGFDAWAGDSTILDFANSLDFAMVYLQEGVLYDFEVQSYDWHPQLAIYDLDGWLLEYDDPDDLLFTIPDDYGQDSIFGFVPEYSGFYYLELGWEYQDDLPGLISIETFGYGHAFEPQILDEDSFLWDATIVTAEGSYVTAEEAQLYRAYLGALGRLPDWDGFQWWSSQIEDGYHDLWSMSAGFIWSDEFQYLADHNYDGWVSNAEFVTHMYEGVFGRRADWTGFDYWYSELQSGRRDQVEVFVDMTQSNEYVELTLGPVAEMQVTI